MMVWIDDRQIGFEDRLTAFVQPVRPNRCMTARRDCGLRHFPVPPKNSFRLPQLCPGRSNNSNCFDTTPEDLAECALACRQHGCAAIGELRFRRFPGGFEAIPKLLPEIGSGWVRRQRIEVEP